jgi:hypothetical protein
VLDRRLAIYHDQTEPLVEYYRARDLLVPLHAERSIDAVFGEIQEALEVVTQRGRKGRVGTRPPIPPAGATR